MAEDGTQHLQVQRFEARTALTNPFETIQDYASQSSNVTNVSIEVELKEGFSSETVRNSAMQR
jgi:hypothetical protein